MSTIKLAYPIENDGETTTELTMRRPKLKDQLRVLSSKKSDAEKEMAMFCNLMEVSPELLKELDLADYGKIQEVYQGFLSLAPTESES